MNDIDPKIVASMYAVVDDGVEHFRLDFREDRPSKGLERSVLRSILYCFAPAARRRELQPSLLMSSVRGNAKARVVVKCKVFSDGSAEAELGDYVGPLPAFRGNEGSEFLDRVQAAVAAHVLRQLGDNPGLASG